MSCSLIHFAKVKIVLDSIDPDLTETLLNFKSIDLNLLSQSNNR